MPEFNPKAALGPLDPDGARCNAEERHFFALF
jgi:hypothetical protein